MIAVASGLSQEGYNVFCYSIGNFSTLRCMEQIRYDVCYHNANVKVVAVGAGYAYGPLGVSHHTTEDIAMLRALPGMQICSPADATEARLAADFMVRRTGPGYVRINKSGEPNVHTSVPQEFLPGKLLWVKEGQDVLVLTTGEITRSIYTELTRSHPDWALASVPFIGNYDSALFVDLAKRFNRIVTVEEHQLNGGFGSSILEALSDLYSSGQLSHMPKLRRLAIPNNFIAKSGTQDYLRNLSGLTLDRIQDRFIKKKITVVTPMFNEEDNITELCDRVALVMKKLPYDYEHICIDNCSTDKTVAILRKRSEGDKNLKVIVNVRNFGHIRSPYHAMLQATGDAVVLIAADLQDPPEMIEDFVKNWEEGFKTVMETKPESEESPMMYAIRRIYYRLIHKISEVSLIPNATGCGLFDREVITLLKGLDDPYLYFRGLVCEVSYPIATVPFKQPRRSRGVTSNNFYTLYDIAMLGITKHSKIPLRLMIFLGFGMAAFSFLAGLGYFLAKLFFGNSSVLGIAPVVLGFFFLYALQVIFLGILGEYIGSIQTHVRKLPHVVEAERINF